MLDSLAIPAPDPNSFVGLCVGVGRTQTLPSSSNKKGGERERGGGGSPDNDDNDWRGRSVG